MTTPLERVRGGDWQTALLAAAGGLLAAIVAAQVMATTWLLISPDEEVPLTAELWLRLVAGLVGTGFWAPVTAEFGGDGGFGGGTSATLAPLLVTLAALVAMYVVLRHARRTEAGAWEHAARAAVPFAVGIALLPGLFGRFSPEGELTIRTMWVEALVFAALLGFATAMLAYRDLWKPLSENVVALREQWWGPVRVAAYGLGAGVALSCVAAVILYFVHADEAQQGWGNVFAALPAFFGVILNAAIALLSISAGGRGAVTAGPTEYVALYRLHDLSPGHWLLVLVPIATVVLTARWAARRGGVSWLRVVAVLVPVWVVLAWASSARFSFGLGGFGAEARAGASIFWGALALAVWFGLVAPFVTPYVTEDVSPTEPMLPEPRPRLQAGPAHVMVTTLAVMAMLWAACGAIVADVRSNEVPERIDRGFDGP